MAVITVKEAMTQLGAASAEDYVFVEMVSKNTATANVDVHALENLSICELRTLAIELGIASSAAKTHDEIITEIRWLAEMTEDYQQAYDY